MEDQILNSIVLDITNSLLIDYGLAYFKLPYKKPEDNFDELTSKWYGENLGNFPLEEGVQLTFVKIDLKVIHKYIEKLVDISFNDAKYMSTDPLDCTENSKKNIMSLINSILYLFDNEEPRDIIYLISYIFKSILVGHNLINGNKRLASMILFNFLYIFAGVSFRTLTSEIKVLFWYVNEKKFIKFVEEYHNIAKSDNFHEEDKKLVEEIYKWIYNNIQIALNFI